MSGQASGTASEGTRKGEERGWSTARVTSELREAGWCDLLQTYQGLDLVPYFVFPNTAPANNKRVLLSATASKTFDFL